MGFLRRLRAGEQAQEPELGPDLTLIHALHERLAALTPPQWIDIFDRIVADGPTAKSDMSRWTSIAVRALPRDRERRGQRDAVLKAVKDMRPVVFEPMEATFSDAGMFDYLADNRPVVQLAVEWVGVITSALGGTAYQLGGFAEFYAPFQSAVPFSSLMSSLPPN